MEFYLIVSLLLWWVAIVSSVCKSEIIVFSFLCAVCFVLVAGLRFQVGYDWPVYELVFNNMNEISPAISSGSLAPLSSKIPEMDFLFELLNSLLKSLGLDFQGLLFVIALINALILMNVLTRYSLNPAACFAIYFGLVYLSAQMIIIRQALAASFILLAFINRIEKKPGRVCAYSIIAMGIHFSSIIFLPLLLSVKRKVPVYWILLLLFPILLLGGPSGVFQLLFDVFGYFDSGAITERLGLYAKGTDAYVDSISVGALAYIIMNMAMLWLMRREMRDDSACEYQASLVVITYNITIFMLIAQVGLYELPTIWNRIQVVAVVLQSIVVVNIISKAKVELRLIAFLMLFMVSNVILGYQLSKDSAADFIPYKTVISKLY